MKFVQLKEDLRRENGYCYLLEGEDLFFIDRATEMIRRKYVAEPSLNESVFDGSALKGDKIVALADALQSLPFMSERRLVRAKDFVPTEKEYKTYLEPLFLSPVETSVLLIVNASPQKKAGGVDWKKKPNVKAVDCSRADETTVVKWIYLTLKRAGVEASVSVCGRIMRYCVFDMARIEKETEKLIAYVGKGELTEQIVDEIVYQDADYKLYEMTNAVAARDSDRFFRIMQDLQSKGYDDMSVLSSLCAYYRGLYEVSVVSGSDRSAAERLGMKEYAVKKNREQARRFPLEKIETWYFSLYDALSEVKSGKRTPKGALAQVVAQILL